MGEADACRANSRSVRRWVPQPTRLTRRPHRHPRNATGGGWRDGLERAHLLAGTSEMHYPRRLLLPPPVRPRGTDPRRGVVGALGRQEWGVDTAPGRRCPRAGA